MEGSPGQKGLLEVFVKLGADKLTARKQVPPKFALSRFVEDALVAQSGV